MKKTLIAFDKFKDALTAHQVCQVAAETLAELQPDWVIETSPLADGGDGFCDTLTKLCEGSFFETEVTGPLGQPTMCTYGIVETSRITDAATVQLALPPDASSLAIVEYAQSSGIALVPQDLRSPWTTTSYGLGETILHAQANGADAILIGLGGSATNDLALGTLQALGYRLEDSDGTQVESLPVPEIWNTIAKIEAPESQITIPTRIACDVENPLLGANGATKIFGPQKGLKDGDFTKLESEMERVAGLLCSATNSKIQSLDTPGAGAAGGAAFGLMVGLGGKIVPGAELVFNWSNLYEKLKGADLVITGEGRFDASSLQGKGPGSLAKECLDRGKSLLVLAGSLGPLPEGEISGSAIAISPEGTPLSQALSETEANLKKAIKSYFSE